MAYDYKTIHFDRHKFDKERIAFNIAIPERDLLIRDRWEIETYQDHVINALVYQLKAFIAHGRKEIKKSTDVPVTWWDHLKLTINIWTRKHLLSEKLFFTNIAKAIMILNLTPKFKQISTYVEIKKYCPHVGRDDRYHVEFMMIEPLNMEELLNEESDETKNQKRRINTRSRKKEK
jgi:hypothetical protein